MGMDKVISAKGRQVVTTTPEELVPAAAQRLREYKIGLLVVCDDGGNVVGVLSERDLVSAVADGGGKISAMNVEALMTRNPTTCDMDDSPHDVLHIMNKEGFRHMPVLKGGKLKGLVSSRDVLKHLLELADLGQATMRKLHDLGLY